MPLISVTKEEWNFAKKQLTQAPAGTKLEHAQLPAALGSKHSFIKINNKIYCLAKGKSSDQMLTQGSMGTAKYAQDEEGNLYIIKIDGDKVSQNQREAEILLDLSIGLGTEVRIDKNKQYTVLRYLGKNLRDIINDDLITLNEKKRMDIAIKFAYQVYGLHHGFLSNSKTAYAHNDIKPDNVTLDMQGNVHLIDFGLSATNPHEKSQVVTGAGSYTAYAPNKQLTAAELDTVSLKRSLFLPKQFYCHRGYNTIDKDDYNAHKVLLPKDLLDKYNLNEFINTFSAIDDAPPDYTTQVMNPLTICAALINAKEDLGISNDEIKQNTLLCHAIVGVYFSSFPYRLKEIIANQKSCKLAAALHIDNAIEAYDQLRMDEELCCKITEVNDTSTALSLLKLKQLNLPGYYNLLINSLPTAQIIEQLVQQNKSDLIGQYLSHHSETLTKVLLFASQHALKQRYEDMINNAELVAAIEALPKDYDQQRLIDLLKNPNISYKQIIAFCLNKDKRNAIDIILDNDPHSIHLNIQQRTDVISNILNDTDTVTAIINFNKLSVDKFYLYKLVTSKDKCQALNILFDAEITSEAAIKDIAWKDKCSEIILLLHTKGLHSGISSVFDKDTYDFLRLLKSKNANQLTEQMFLNERFCEVLFKNWCDDKKILWLITLFDKKLFTPERYAILNNNYFLFKQVINLIKAGYSSCINDSTLPHNIQSVEEFMLNIAAQDYRALNCLDYNFKNDFRFMLAAVAKDVKTLEFASDSLKSDASFMTKAVQINHQAFNYASDSLKNNDSMKQEIKRTVLNYQYVNKNDSRYHFFTAHFNEQDPLKAKYKNKTGDALKTTILKELKHSLEGKNDEQINELANTFKKGMEYKMLCTAQGLISSIFKLQTSSAIAVEKIIKEAHEIANTKYTWQ